MPETAARLAALARISSLLRSGLPSRQVIENVIAIVPEIIPADAYAIWRYDGRAGRWEIVSSAGISDDYLLYSIEEIRNEAVLSKGPFSSDVSTWPMPADRRVFYDVHGFRQAFVIPLHIRGEAAGTLSCYFKTPREISEEEQQLATVLSEVVSAAVNSRKFDRFAEAARVVAGELDLQRIVQAVTDAATELTNAQFGAFFYNVVNASGESYTLYTISGVPREAFSKFPMPRNTAVFEPTFSGKGIVRSADIRRDPRYGQNAPHHGMPEGHLPVVSYLAVPVVSRSSEVLGGLFFGHGEVGVFTENEEQIAAALADQAAVAIDNARLYGALAHERERLARSEARYKALVMAAPNAQAIWIADADGTVTDDLAAWRDITGQSVDEVHGWGWAEAIHPDHRHRVIEDWRRAVESRVPITGEHPLRVRDGGYRWHATTAVPVVDDKGAIIEWVGTTIDIDERRTAADRQQFLAQATELLTSSLDYETTLTTLARLVVPEIADWCAVDIADEEGEGHRRLAVAHKDPAKVELAHDLRRRFPPDPKTDTVARVLRTGKAEWMAQIPEELIRDADITEEHRQMLLSLNIRSFIVVPLKTRERVFGAFTLVSSDSSRQFTEADLAFAEELGRRASVAVDNARLYTAAQAANRAKDEFLATLSHELRTPMTAVLGWARMLKMGLEPSDQGQAIDAIEHSATMQMDLIEDILDMSRILAGKMRMEAAPVDLRAATEGAIATVHPAAAAKNIEILTSIPADLPAVLGDAARLQQVVWNLVTNAIKFTQRGGTVTVRLAAKDGTVSISVRDNGRGIPRSFLPHVFEPFRQQDSSTTRAHGGIGLGLAIVRSLVELHGGTIGAESEGEGHGATFTVELPALRDGRRTGTPTATGDELPSLQGKAVLVIDDQKPTRDVIAAILRRAGAAVACAETVTEAFAEMNDHQPDVIVCDIAMPGEDGYDFVRRLRESDARMPVIALTAFGRPEDREKALSRGFTAFLKKPVDPMELAETVREVGHVN